jgi:hypothetical protein
MRKGSRCRMVNLKNGYIFIALDGWNSKKRNDVGSKLIDKCIKYNCLLQEKEKYWRTADFYAGSGNTTTQKVETPCPKAMKLLYYYVKETAPERGC